MDAGKKTVSKDAAQTFINKIREIIADCELLEDSRDCCELVREAMQDAGIPFTTASWAEPAGEEQGFKYDGPPLEIQ